jgi:hypothetical protein
MFSTVVRCHSFSIIDQRFKNNNMNYFETVTSPGIYSARRPGDVRDLNVMQILAGSQWKIRHLFAARVLVRKPGVSSSKDHHLLPLLRQHFDQVVTARDEPRIQKIVNVPKWLGQHQGMSETELIHLYGTSLGSFWAALAQFDDLKDLDNQANVKEDPNYVLREIFEEFNSDVDDVDVRDGNSEVSTGGVDDVGGFLGLDGVDERDDNAEDDWMELEDGLEEDYRQRHQDVPIVDHRKNKNTDRRVGKSNKRPCSASSDESASALPLPLPIPGKRVRTTIHRKGYVDPTTIQIDDSSPQRSSQQQPSQGVETGFVSGSHASSDVPEQATLEIASAFIRHVLRASLPQDNLKNHKPPSLVRFLGVSREFSGFTASGEEVRATADGELVLDRLDGSNTYRRTGHRPALLEAKKQFGRIENGRPVLTNELLGQMTCEALALRLQRAAETNNQAGEK